MWLRVPRSLFAPFLVLAAGCAAKTGIHVLEAESALRAAGEFDAQDRAAYEYTMALRYLEKAREEHGYAEYKSAQRLARKSAEWSDRAIIYVERGGGIDIDPADFLPEQVAPSTPPPPMLAPPLTPPPDPNAPSDEELFAPSEPVTTPPPQTPAEPAETEDEEPKQFEEIRDEEFEWDQ